MRRARRIDVWEEDGFLGIDAMFRDSCWDPDGTEVVIHEYQITARRGRATGCAPVGPGPPTGPALRGVPGRGAERLVDGRDGATADANPGPRAAPRHATAAPISTTACARWPRCPCWAASLARLNRAPLWPTAQPPAWPASDQSEGSPSLTCDHAVDLERAQVRHRLADGRPAHEPCDVVPRSRPLHVRRRCPRRCAAPRAGWRSPRRSDPGGAGGAPRAGRAGRRSGTRGRATPRRPRRARACRATPGSHPGGWRRPGDGTGCSG